MKNIYSDFLNWKSPAGRKLPDAKNRPLIMGILNVTSDSFSDGGMYFDLNAALRHAEQMTQDGVDIIDIGAESTRPGASILSEPEERERLIPKIAALRERFPEIPISVDTYKPTVAEAAIEAGADIINDVLAATDASGYPMAAVAAKCRAPLVITHNCRDCPKNSDFFDFYMGGLKSRLDSALAEGLDKSQIVLDPGFGFGKTVAQNYMLVENLSKLRDFGCGVLLGVSRKSSLAEVVGADFDARDDATAVITSLCAANRSCDIFRVHDVKKNQNALKIVEKLRENRI